MASAAAPEQNEGHESSHLRQSISSPHPAVSPEQQASQPLGQAASAPHPDTPPALTRAQGEVPTGGFIDAGISLYFWAILMLLAAKRAFPLTAGRCF